jgi:hypothetical protein
MVNLFIFGQFMLKKLFLFFIFSSSCLVFAQQFAVVSGKITNPKGLPVSSVSIGLQGTSMGVVSNSQGDYQIEIPAHTNVDLVFSHLGYELLNKRFFLTSKDTVVFNPILKQISKEIGEVEIQGEQNRTTTLQKIDPKLISRLPSASGNFEAILFSQAGVVSNNELSSQYSVRGGNFDENLVYVNDIEIYRPFLIRSGQQEGLSFTNADLVQSVQFSAGGFDAQYGDKMSSVLDIQYKKPEQFAGSARAGLLGGSFHLENQSKNHRFTQIHGLRYFSNRYILGSMDTKGDYTPSFTDYQTYLTYDLTDKLELEFLGNIAKNKYQFIPQTRQSDFGTLNEGLRLTVYFDGKEIDEYFTALGAFSLNYQPTSKIKLKFTVSSFTTKESETFDILGQYWLDELERDISSDNFGDIAFNRGIGTFLNHGRNYLDARILNFAHNGKYYGKSNTLLWGLKVQHEDIIDKWSEWTMIDSAGYSIPQYPSDEIQLFESFKSNNHVISQRISGFIQNNKSWTFNNNAVMTLNAGIRSNYWTFNQQLLFSPRATLSFKPNWDRDFLFKLSAGIYHQPPFYREMRNFEGEINPNIKAQRAIHYVLASDYNFKVWNRPFKLINELYYKKLDNLIPYKIDNVRLRYYGENNASGYAYGFDSKINGEFVKGVDSWASISIMKIMEDLKDDFYISFYDAEGNVVYPAYAASGEIVDTVTHYPGFIPRPTDQRVTFGLFFQDYIPNRPQFKMHLNLLYGSGLPFGPPGRDRYKDVLRMPSYRRVDIGFSYAVFDQNTEKPKSQFAQKFESLWLSVEVWNLLQVNNTVSYLWIRDVSNRQYAVPNYLTSRRLNVKISITF